MESALPPAAPYPEYAALPEDVAPPMQPPYAPVPQPQRSRPLPIPETRNRRHARDDDEDDDEPPRRSRNTEKVVLVDKPSAFNGNKNDFHAWWMQIIDYITTYQYAFETDHAMIKFTLSYMKSGDAAEFALNCREEALLDDEDLTTLDYGSWRDFAINVKAQFQNINRSQDALTLLKNCRQGSDTANNFFIRFDRLARRAKMQKQDAFLTDLLLAAVNPTIMKPVYQHDPLPKTYKQFREKIINIDQHIRIYNAANRGQPQAQPQQSRTPQGQFRPRPQQQAPPSPAVSKPTWTPAMDKRDATGIIHGGQGMPMDTSRQRLQCAFCNKKGHTEESCFKKYPELKNRAQDVRQDSPSVLEPDSVSSNVLEPPFSLDPYPEVNRLNHVQRDF